MHREGSGYKGSCFVTYSNRKHAFEAIKNLNMRNVFENAKPLEVRFADTRKK
jgi:RNA recognition motif-containing protein